MFLSENVGNGINIPLNTHPYTHNTYTYIHIQKTHINSLYSIAYYIYLNKNECYSG